MFPQFYSFQSLEPIVNPIVTEELAKRHQTLDFAFEKKDTVMINVLLKKNLIKLIHKNGNLIKTVVPITNSTFYSKAVVSADLEIIKMIYDHFKTPMTMHIVEALLTGNKKVLDFVLSVSDLHDLSATIILDIVVEAFKNNYTDLYDTFMPHVISAYNASLISLKQLTTKFNFEQFLRLTKLMKINKFSFDLSLNFPKEDRITAMQFFINKDVPITNSDLVKIITCGDPQVIRYFLDCFRCKMAKNNKRILQLKKNRSSTVLLKNGHLLDVIDTRNPEIIEMFFDCFKQCSLNIEWQKVSKDINKRNLSNDIIATLYNIGYDQFENNSKKLIMLNKKIIQQRELLDYFIKEWLPIRPVNFIISDYSGLIIGLL